MRKEEIDRGLTKLVSEEVSFPFCKVRYNDYEVIFDWDGSLGLCQGKMNRRVYGVTVIVRGKRPFIGWSGNKVYPIIHFMHIERQDVVKISKLKSGKISISNTITFEDKRYRFSSKIDYRWKRLYHVLVGLFENPCVRRAYDRRGFTYIKLNWRDFRLILEGKFLEDFIKSGKCLNDRISEVLPTAKSPIEIFGEG